MCNKKNDTLDYLSINLVKICRSLKSFYPKASLGKPFIISKLNKYVSIKSYVKKNELIKGLKKNWLQNQFANMGATFGRGTIYENINYQYIFVSLIEYTDDIAVVGKTSFWRNSSFDLGDLFKPYKNDNIEIKGKNGTKNLVLRNYPNIKSVNESIKSAIIIPIDINYFTTQSKKTRTYTDPDKIALFVEREIRKSLLKKPFCIVNKN